MRKYGTIPCTLWDDPTIKQFGLPTYMVALYLRSNKHSNMVHLYALSPLYASADLCIPAEEYLECLDNLVSIGYCRYSPDHNVIWVRSAMLFDIGAKMAKNDKRIKGLNKLLPMLPNCPLKEEFVQEFSKHYGIK